MSHSAFAITVEGLPVAFRESTFPASELSAWASTLATITEISEGSVDLDLGARRQIGSGFQWTMRDVGNVLRSLITPRQDPVAWMVEASIPANTTSISFVEVNDVTNIPATFYLGAETLSYNGTAAGPVRIANVSRALYGSTAQLAYGSADDGHGVAIYAQPPKWTGRKVTLWESVQDDAGTMGTKTAIATARLENPPSFVGNDTWDFQAESLAQWYARRPIFQGFEAITAPDDDNDFQISAPMALETEDFKRLWNGGTQDNAFVIWDLEDGAFWASPLTSSTTTTVTLGGGPFGAGIFQGATGASWVSARPALVWQGDPVDLTLSLLGSQLGDGALGAWDVLLGRHADAFGGVQWYAGAGINNADLDLTAFEAFRGDGPSWTMVIDAQTSVESILMEFCQAVGAFWYVDGTGRISVGRLQERVPPSSSALSLGDSLWSVASNDAIGISEATVHHSVEFSANWDPVAKQFGTTVTVVDAPARQEAPFDDRVLKLASKFVGIEVGQWDVLSPQIPHANPLTRPALETQLRRVQQYSKRPSAEVQTNVPATSVTKSVVVGSIIDVTNARIPDLQGGTLSANLGLVVGRQRHYDKGSLDFRVRILDAGFLFAPAVEVTAVASAGGTLWDLTVSTATPYGDATNPGLEFTKGWSITNTLGTRTGSVSSNTTATNVRIDTAGTPVVGDIYVPVYGTGLDVNAQGFAPNDFTYCVNDAGSSTVKTRWS